MYRKTYVEVNTSILEQNIKNIIKKYNNYDYYIGVVKGNAYGHGMEVVKYLAKAGINFFAVSSLEEALELRKYDKKTPVLCLEPIEVEDLQICIDKNISITIHSYEYYEQLLALDYEGKIKAHLKLDTGMNRLGIKYEQEVKEIYDTLLVHEKIELEGIYSHFGTLGVWDKSWYNQVRKFNELTRNIDLNKIKVVHFARGQNIINHGKIPGTNGVRLGISMYGYVNKFTNSAQTFMEKLRKAKFTKLRKGLGLSDCIYDDVPDVKPAITVKSKIVQIKEVKKGEIVGYGEDFKAQTDMLIATVPIGYVDGINVKNAGRNVEINGKLYKIVGTVNMCMLSIAVDNDVKVGDMVNILGGKIDPKYVANYLGENRYTVIATIPKELPRIYVSEEKSGENEER